MPTEEKDFYGHAYARTCDDKLLELSSKVTIELHKVGELCELLFYLRCVNCIELRELLSQASIGIVVIIYSDEWLI